MWSYCRVLRGGGFLKARYPCTLSKARSSRSEELSCDAVGAGGREGLRRVGGGARVL